MNCPIVVPLDGMYESERALPLAVELAQRSKALLILLRVDEAAPRFAIRESSQNADSPSEIVRRRAEERDQLEGVAAELRRRGLKEVQVAVESGPVGATIARYARSVGASFLAMSTRAGTGIGAVLWGRIAEDVIRDTHLPVLVQPAPASRPRGRNPVKRVLVALDGTDLGEVILGPVVELAQRFEAEVTLLHVIGEHARAGGNIDPLIWSFSDPVAGYADCASLYLRRWVERLAAQGVAARPLVSDGGAPAGVIAREAIEGGADLIALGTHTRKGIARLAIGSNVAAMLRSSTLPLLLCHPPLARRSALSSDIEHELAER